MISHHGQRQVEGTVTAPVVLNQRNGQIGGEKQRKGCSLEFIVLKRAPSGLLCTPRIDRNEYISAPPE